MTTKSTRALIERLNDLSADLNQTPPCSDRRNGSNQACLTRLRKDARGRVRAFSDLGRDAEAGRMCDACAALWHVDMAEIALRRVEQVEAEIAAEKEARS